MVRARAAVCSRVHTSPFGVCPFGSTSLRSVQPSAHYVSPNYAALHLSFLRSQPRFTRLNAHSRSVGRGYFRSFLTPIAHVQPSLPFASTSLAFGRILPRSSVGLASLAFGTIGLILRHDCVCACDFFSKFLNFFLRLGDKHYFFEIADVTVGYARVLSE